MANGNDDLKAGGENSDPENPTGQAIDHDEHISKTWEKLHANDKNHKPHAEHKAHAEHKHAHLTWADPWKKSKPDAGRLDAKLKIFNLIHGGGAWGMAMNDIMGGKKNVAAHAPAAHGAHAASDAHAKPAAPADKKPGEPAAHDAHDKAKPDAHGKDDKKSLAEAVKDAHGKTDAKDEKGKEVKKDDAHAKAPEKH
jgi:hypothetical protein